MDATNVGGIHPLRRLRLHEHAIGATRTVEVIDVGSPDSRLEGFVDLRQRHAQGHGPHLVHFRRILRHRRTQEGAQPHDERLPVLGLFGEGRNQFFRHLAQAHRIVVLTCL